MTLEILSFNILAVLVCFVTNMIIGGLWYSPVLFGNQWLKLIGKKAEDISKKDAGKSMILGMIPALVMSILMAVILNFTRASTILDALIVGTVITLGFIGMSFINMVIFEGRSFKLALLNIGYSFVSLNIAALILVLWK